MREYDWIAPSRGQAYLALADGHVFPGRSVGAALDIAGQAVFNTAMTGYPEILSDPSYTGQFVCLTAPEIGVYGVEVAELESDAFRVSGLLMHRLSAETFRPRAESLASALIRFGVPALAGIDTRALTLCLRNHGTQNAFLCSTGTVPPEEGILRAQAWEGLDGRDYASRVSCPTAYSWTPSDAAKTDVKPDRSMIVYDFGVKRGILRALARHGFAVTVVPSSTSAADVLALRPDGIVFSNGPGDPSALGYAVQTLRNLLGKVPMMGICLGHQLLGLACGAKTYRLPFGHHGANHPVRETFGECPVWITAQNHNYAVDAESLPSARVDVTHINLNDGSVEGLACRDVPAFSIQFHPEAAPGPHDSKGLFGRFRELIETGK